MSLLLDEGAGPQLFTQDLTGSITPSGSLTKRTNRTLSASTTPSGSITNSKIKPLSLSGEITPTGFEIAAPVVKGRTSGSLGSGSGQIIYHFNLPADIEIGDLLLVVLATAPSGVTRQFTPDSGWETTQFSKVENMGVFSASTGATSVRVYLLWKICSDTSADAILDVTIGDGIGPFTHPDVAYISFRIANAGGPHITMNFIETASADPNPPSSDSSLKELPYLWIALRAAESQVQATAEPSGYSNFTLENNADGPALETAERLPGPATFEDPGAFTAAADEAIVGTIGISPKPYYYKWLGEPRIFVQGIADLRPAGSLRKLTTKATPFSGTTSPSGQLYLTQSKTYQGSISPSGALVNQPQKYLSGSISPSGALVNQPQKYLSGSTTISGALTANALYSLLLSGDIIPQSELFRLVNKILSGYISHSAALTKQVSNNFTGSITPSGVLIRQTNVNVIASITPSGTFAAQFLATRLLSGFISPSGALVNQPQKYLTSSVTTSSELIHRVDVTLTGTTTPFGSFTKTPQISFSGSISPSSSLTNGSAFSRSFSGSFTPEGALDATFIQGEPPTQPPPDISPIPHGGGDLSSYKTSKRVLAPRFRVKSTFELTLDPQLTSDLNLIIPLISSGAFAYPSLESTVSFSVPPSFRVKGSISSSLSLETKVSFSVPMRESDIALILDDED